ncbi:hypothetical protein DSO57_1014307 [Entomophthora muscae]|uniref:Uncharacterized protein n=1 Tax=Entomophthora muscae TaxID=34485 RepID=A0ACC2TT80_9FUNG|nr:hypothetical protein DSO57_1014307 [Entomophthora muscae]
MLVSVFKFVVFTLAPVLVFILTTSPYLWGQIFSSAHYTGDNPTHFLYLLNNLPGRAQDLLVTEDYLFNSLTCDDLELLSPDSEIADLVEKDNVVCHPPIEPETIHLKEKSNSQEHTPSCTP